MKDSRIFPTVFFSHKSIRLYIQTCEVIKTVPKNNIRGIVEGAIMNGIFIILLLVALYTPLSFITFVLPLPFLIYASRHGMKSIIITSLAAVLLSFLVGGVLSIFSAIVLIIPGIIMGIAYRRQFSTGKVVFFGMLGHLVSNLMLLLILNSFFHMNIPDMFLKMVDQTNQSIQLNMDQMLKNPAPEQQTPQFMQQIKDTKQFFNEQTALFKSTFLTLSPTLLVMVCLLQTYISLFLSRVVLKRMGVDVPNFPTFQNLRFPRSILYYYFIVLVLFLFPDITKYPFLHKVAENGQFILSWLLMIQGLAVLAKVGAQRHWNKVALRIGLIVLFLSPLNIILLFIGIIELVFDFRNRFSEK